jgi:pimeloyl-ACP methyl ester carboxylesterase
MRPGAPVIEHEMVALGDVTLHLAHAGRGRPGPPIVLLHGFPESWYAWRDQLERLGATRHVVAPDLRGYGSSSRPTVLSQYRMEPLVADVIAIADHLDAPRVDLAGHDWGGVIAWHVAARHRDRLDRLTILNAPHPRLFARALRRSPRQMLASAYILLFRAPGHLAERVLRAGDFALLDRLVQRRLARGDVTAADAAAHRAAWRIPGALTAMLNYYRAAGDGADFPDAPIEVSTTVLWGERDRYLRPTLLDGLDQLVRRLSVHRVPDATHWIVQEQPAMVAEAILGTRPSAGDSGTHASPVE